MPDIEVCHVSNQEHSLLREEPKTSEDVVYWDEFFKINPVQGYNHELTQLRTNHYAIIRMTLEGMTSFEIAAELGLNETTVQKCLQSTLGREHMANLTKALDTESIEVGQRIRELAPKAVELLEGILAGDPSIGGVSASLRVKTAQDILDRAGHGKSVNINVDKKLSFGIDAIKKRAIEIGIIQGKVLDTTAKEINDASSPC